MKKWLKICAVIFLFAVISLCVFLILKGLGITNFENLKSVIIRTKQWGLITYLLIQIICLVLLCFVPLLNTSLIILGISIFGSIWTFIISMLAIIISSTILFFIGDKFGEKLAKKLVGKKDFELAQIAVDTKSKILLPFFYILPGFPDEALCLVAGMTKMKYWYLMLVTIVYHIVEIGMFCFLGSELVDWSALSAIDWIILANVVILDLIFLFKLEKKLTKKQEKTKSQNEIEK